MAQPLKIMVPGMNDVWGGREALPSDPVEVNGERGFYGPSLALFDEVGVSSSGSFESAKHVTGAKVRHPRFVEHTGMGELARSSLTTTNTRPRVQKLCSSSSDSSNTTTSLDNNRKPRFSIVSDIIDGIEDPLGRSAVRRLRYAPSHDSIASVSMASTGGNIITAKAPESTIQRGFKTVYLKLYDFMLASMILTLTVIEVIVITFRLAYARSPASDSGYKTFEILLDSCHILFLLLHLFVPHSTPGGDIVIGSKQIISRYMLNYFYIDGIAAFPSSALTWSLAGNSIFFRFNKLVGLLAWHRRFNFVLDKVSLEFQLSPLIIRLMRHMVIFLTAIHIVSCAWYAVLDRDFKDGHSVNALITETAFQYNYAETHRVAGLYLLGFDWGMKYMCGYGVVGPFPETDRQLIVMLCTAFVGVSLFAIFLGTVTTLVADLAMNNVAARLRTKIDEVTDALSSMQMPKDFQDATKRYYVQVFKMAGTVGSTSLLDDLPDVLLCRVNNEIAKGIVSKVPLFRSIKDPAMICDMMVRLTPKIFLPGLRLVKYGDLGNEMFFVQNGELLITNESEEQKAVLTPGSFYGEGALLQNVKRVTNVTTLTSCMLLVLVRQDFEEVLERHPKLEAIMQLSAARKLQKEYQQGTSTCDNDLCNLESSIRSLSESTARKYIGKCYEDGGVEDMLLSSSSCLSVAKFDAPNISVKTKQGGLGVGTVRSVSEHLQKSSDAEVGSFLFGQTFEPKMPTVTVLGRNPSTLSNLSSKSSLSSMGSGRLRQSPSASGREAMLCAEPVAKIPNQRSPRHSLEDLM